MHVWEGISLADGVPISLFRSAFDTARFPDLPAALARLQSVTAALAAGRIAWFSRAAAALFLAPQAHRAAAAA